MSEWAPIMRSFKKSNICWNFPLSIWWGTKRAAGIPKTRGKVFLMPKLRFKSFWAAIIMLFDLFFWQWFESLVSVIKLNKIVAIKLVFRKWWFLYPKKDGSFSCFFTIGSSILEVGTYLSMQSFFEDVNAREYYLSCIRPN